MGYQKLQRQSGQKKRLSPHCYAWYFGWLGGEKLLAEHKWYNGLGVCKYRMCVWGRMCLCWITQHSFGKEGNRAGKGSALGSPVAL